jgi:hypothetical protein
MAVGLAGLVRWRSDAGVKIGLAVPGRPFAQYLEVATGHVPPTGSGDTS